MESEILKTLIGSGAAWWQWMFVVIALLLVLFGRRVYDDIYHIIKSKRIRTTMSDLSDHQIFGDLICHRSQLHSINMKNKVKRDLVIDFLHIRLEVITDMLKDVCKSSIESMSEYELKKHIISKVSLTIKTYKRVAVEKGIPKTFVDKFIQRSKYKTNELLGTIHSVFDMKTGKNMDKVFIIFTFIEGMLYYTVEDAYDIILNMNGELESLSYKGKTIGL